MRTSLLQKSLSIVLVMLLTLGCFAVLSAAEPEQDAEPQVVLKTFQLELNQLTAVTVLLKGNGKPVVSYDFAFTCSEGISLAKADPTLDEEYLTEWEYYRNYSTDSDLYYKALHNDHSIAVNTSNGMMGGYFETHLWDAEEFSAALEGCEHPWDALSEYHQNKYMERNMVDFEEAQILFEDGIKAYDPSQFELYTFILQSDDKTAVHGEVTVTGKVSIGGYGTGYDRYSADIVPATIEVDVPGEPQKETKNKCGDAVYWKLEEDGTLVLSGVGATYDYSRSETPWVLDETIHATEYYDEEWNRCPPDIKNIRVEKGVTTLREGVFAGLTVSDIYIADTVQAISMPWAYDTISGIGTDNPYFRVVDNVLFNADMTELLAHPASLNEFGAAYHIPEGVQVISGGQFTRGAVVFPESVTRINAGAATMFVYNRNCVFDDFAIPDVLGQHVVYGHEGSTAEAYAEEHGFVFISLEKPVINTYGARQVGSLVTVSPYMMPQELLQLAGENAKLEPLGSVTLAKDATLGSGMKIVKNDGTELTIVIKGDNDGDGKISAADARLALRRSVSLEKFTDWQNAASLVDGDEKISSADARMILRASVGLEDTDEWYR